MLDLYDRATIRGVGTREDIASEDGKERLGGTPTDRRVRGANHASRKESG